MSAHNIIYMIAARGGSKPCYAGRAAERIGLWVFYPQPRQNPKNRAMWGILIVHITRVIINNKKFVILLYFISSLI